MTWQEGSAAGIAESSGSGAGTPAKGAGFAGLSAWALFALAAVFAVQSALATGFFDTDYFWHLETGRWIVAEGRLPEGDIFSHSFEGAPWALHEWLAQLLLFLVHDLGGRLALLLFTAALSGGALYLVYALAARCLGRALVAAALTLFFSAGLLNYVAPRPQVFSYLLFALWLTLIWRARYEGHHGPLLLLPLIMLLWVNLHGGYVIGLCVALAYLVLDALSHRFSAEPLPRGGRYLGFLGAGLVLSVLAVAINPDGLERYAYPFQVMSMSANSLIGEWGSFDFHRLDNKWVLLSVLAYLFLAARAPRRLDLSELLVPLITIGAALTSVRHAPYAAMVMTAYGALALSGTPLYRRWHEKEAAKTQGGGPLVRLRWLAPPLLLLGLLAAPFNPRYWERMEAIEPNDMMALIRDADLTGPLYNAYGVGGYLIHALGPGRPVLIDGRADLYGDAFVEEVAGAAKGEAGWRDSLERWDAQYLVLYRDSVLAALLDLDPDFGLVCQESGFSLYVRRAGPNGGLAPPEDAGPPATTVPRPC